LALHTGFEQSNYENKVLEKELKQKEFASDL
jgi:hypothetical protein